MILLEPHNAVHQRWAALGIVGTRPVELRPAEHYTAAHAKYTELENARKAKGNVTAASGADARNITKGVAVMNRTNV